MSNLLLWRFPYYFAMSIIVFILAGMPLWCTSLVFAGLIVSIGMVLRKETR